MIAAMLNIIELFPVGMKHFSPSSVSPFAFDHHPHSSIDKQSNNAATANITSEYFHMDYTPHIELYHNTIFYTI
jgi:hypothetical protein